MKNLVFITNSNPFPGNSGGTKKTRLLIDNLLNRGYVIDLLFLTLPSDERKNIDLLIDKYKNSSINIHFCENKNNIRSVKNFIKSIFLLKPLNILRNYSKSFKKKVLSVISDETEIIFCDHIEMLQYIPRKYLARTILHEHNAEFVILKRYGDIYKNPIIKLGLKFEGVRYRNYEQTSCEKVSITLAAPDDILLLKRNTKGVFKTTYHLGNDELLNLPDLKYKNSNLRLLFIGTMTWESNVNGINWFVKNVLPLIKEKYPNVIVDVIGKYSDLTDFVQDDNVIYHGFVDCLEDYFIKDNIFICPLQFGSGMKIKVIEAMYRGIPLVTTSIGAESIFLKDGENAFIADTPECFAKKVVKLYENETLWYQFMQNSRICARENYLWNDEINRIIDTIEKVNTEYNS